MLINVTSGLNLNISRSPFNASSGSTELRSVGSDPNPYPLLFQTTRILHRDPLPSLHLPL